MVEKFDLERKLRSIGKRVFADYFDLTQPIQMVN